MPDNNKKKILVASDHGGFELKEHVKKHLAARGCEIYDFGPEILNPADDYPDFSYPLAQAVAEDETSLGVLLCRSGQGVCIVANKVHGVRAATAWNKDSAAAGRRDDHVNIVCLPSDYLSPSEAVEVVDSFLASRPGEEEKYIRRLKKIKAIEAEEAGRAK